METNSTDTGQDPRVRVLVAMLADVPWSDLTDMFGVARATEVVQDARDELAALRRRKQEAA